MPVKKLLEKKPTTSLRAKAKQSKSDTVITKIVTKPAVSRNDKLSIPVYSLAGRATGTMSLPKEIFGVPVNKKLLSQAMRVYMTNQKHLPGNTKTRGQVEGSSVKIYRQKGTGRARHGSIRASIFVGGGIVFGPTPRKVILDLPKKMKKASLVSALSSKVTDKKTYGLTGVEKASGKTKEIVQLLEKLSSKDGALIVTGEKVENLNRAVGNIPGVDVLSVNLINTLEVLKHDVLLLTKEAADKLGGKK